MCLFERKTRSREEGCNTTAGGRENFKQHAFVYVGKTGLGRMKGRKKVLQGHGGREEDNDRSLHGRTGKLCWFRKKRREEKTRCPS